jgi:spore maturation protein SpmA
MILNYLWAAFLIIAFIVGLIKLIVFGDTEVLPAMLQSTFDNARAGFEISLGLVGVMTLWLGLMKIGEKGGMVPILSRFVGPFFARLFPEVPKNHPAIGSIIMNFSANILGLDNAATPIGLKAMNELQEINPNKDVASNAQMMFLVLNASGLTVIPIAIMADRASMGSVDPASIFIPTLIATFCSTFVGLVYMCLRQRINLFDPVILAYIFGMMALIAGVIFHFSGMPTEEIQRQSSLATAVIILTVIIGFVSLGLRRRIPIFETFVDGAKEGFTIGVKVIPFIVGILVAIGMLRKSGTLDGVEQAIAWAVTAMGINADWVPTVPVALLKPLSGAGARSVMMEVTKAHGGPDVFVGQLASIIRGCAETTLYLLALYFGSVGIRNTRYAVVGGLIADLAGIVASIFVAYLFFH